MTFFTIIASQYWLVAYNSGETAFDSTWGPAPLASSLSYAGRRDLLLLLQGFPELFRAFSQNGKRA